MDKTGTLTTGRPAVVEIVPLGHANQHESLMLAAAVEAASEHPLAGAVVAAARAAATYPLPQAVDVRAIPGQGVAGWVGGRSIEVGSSRWNDGLSPGQGTTASPRSEVAPLARAGLSPGSAAGLTQIVTAVDGVPVLAIGIDDPVRAGARGGVGKLSSMGIRVVMATGDDHDVARRVAAEVGIDEVHSELTPEDKIELLHQLRSLGGTVAMVGDGINDAAALAAADVGIAIGAGSGLALAAADITLVHGDVGAVADAIALSRATRRVIWQNLGWAFGYNLALVPLAALGILPPLLAAVAMAISSVTVVLNALRLRRFERP
jgi:Cu+-exporting ATPase